MSRSRASGGAVLVVAGVWVLAQVLAGHALQRLGLVSPEAGTEAGGDPAIGPDQEWLPKTSPGYRDGQGRPL